MLRKKRKKFKNNKFKPNSRFIGRGIIWVFFLFSCLGISYLIYNSETFKIKNSDIKSNIALSHNTINKIKGHSLFNLDVKAISSYLLDRHSEYKAISVSKKFPSTIIIDIKKRIPFAQMKKKEIYLIDREGVILNNLGLAGSEGLITIEINDYRDSLFKGHRVSDQRLDYAFKLIEVLQAENLLAKLEVESINATVSSAIYFLAKIREANDAQRPYLKNFRVIIGMSDYGQRIKILKDLIDRKLEDKIFEIRYIDLRHKKVYVGFDR